MGGVGGLVTDSVQERSQLLDAFRNAMRHVAATVYAVTTSHEGQHYGILATAVNSLSFDPPSLLTCINRDASVHDPLMKQGKFCVNVLAQANRDVAEHFMIPTAPDRFSIGSWVDVAGVPVLESAQSSFVCRLADCHEFGTHSIVIGELLEARHRVDAAPLTYFDRSYVDITSAPEH
jgi:flavin reductase (DIM6/NTAB) family NADH-FMN oxidoreductase RutF